MTGDQVVIGCDSLLELDGVGLGKPADADEAVRRWRMMRGRSGVLHTGHHLVRLPGRESRTATASTTVHFANLDDAEIDAYVATGEPLLVAGAFTVDGLGGPYVERIEGDHHNVVGISLPLLRLLLADLGVSWTELRGRVGAGGPAVHLDDDQWYPDRVVEHRTDGASRLARSQAGRSTIADVAPVPVNAPVQPWPANVIASPASARASMLKSSLGKVALR